MKNVYNIGERQERCGTSAIISFLVDVSLDTLTRNDRSDRKD